MNTVVYTVETNNWTCVIVLVLIVFQCVLQLYRRIMKANQFIFGKKKNIEMMVVVVVISWDAFVFKIEPMDVAAVLGETI